MTITVDLIVIGSSGNALAAAVASARFGSQVLVITRTAGQELRRRIRRARRAAGSATSKRIAVLGGTEVECIAGVRSVEAVLAREIRTGRCVDINTKSLMTFDDGPDEGSPVDRRGAVR